MRRYDALARTEKGMTFGVMLPHFGREASRRLLLRGAALAERLGYDALWVRDHLIWTPHRHEGADLTFLDATVTLAAVAGVTERIKLGTAVLIPIRWPLKSAKELMSLDFLAGGGRVVAGIGAGHFGAEIRAAGLDPDRKKEIVEETMEIWRRAFTEERVDFSGRVFGVEGAVMHPRPAGGLPIWYGGTTRAAVRRTARWGDGWLPGGTPFPTFDDRVSYLRSLEAEMGRPPCVVGVIPKLRIARTRAEALSGLDIGALTTSSEGSRYWIHPPGGYRDFDDLRGILVAGDIAEIVERVGDFDQRGVDHFLVDLRSDFHRFEELLELFAVEVIPHFRRL